MAVSNGQLANQTNFNAAFLSRTVDSDTTAIVGLQNTDAASGDTISNAQQAINAGRWQTYATETISASGTVSYNNVEDFQLRRVAGDAAAVTASNKPFGTSLGSLRDGATFRIVGTNDTNTVTFTHSDTSYGMILNGNATLGRYYILQVYWDSFFQRFIEISRNF